MTSAIDGMEHVSITRHSEREVLRTGSRNYRHSGTLKARNDTYLNFTNKTLAPEQTDFMIQQLERKADLRLRRTYRNGVALKELDSSAPVLTVGLKFLPGADKPQVTRIEQIDMKEKAADQRDALWRVDTAGSLLCQYDISPDLQIVRGDQTASIVARAQQNQARERGNGSSDQWRAITSRRRNIDTVTIDSDRVTIVKDLRSKNWDLSGLLVEVDGSSLWGLMLNYKHLIAQGGPEMTFEETRDLLDTMIEDARRLCIRSPILFRMSTRRSIINSPNTRYGINHGPMFSTLITSKGIKEIISISAAYYNSLDPTATDDRTQKYIKPRFLQMIVLLLSLLNNEDLAELKDFLEATYKLKAERRDIELLILKVVPLLSINPRVFLNALVPTIEGFPPSGDTDNDEDHGHIWNVFVRRILEFGYLLPGTVDDLGRKTLSWIVKWPESGFKSTTIFNTLQYVGSLRTINDIPPIEVHPGTNCTELTVVMTDDSKYTIHPQDLENIMYMTPGSYPVQETAGRGRFHDLSIRETLLNDELCKAVKLINEIVSKVNQWLAAPKRSTKLKNKLVRQRSDNQLFLNDIGISGRLMEVVAVLKHTTLAVAHKVEGRRIGKADVVHTMARDIRSLRAYVDHIERRGDTVDFGFFGGEKRELKQSLEQAISHINLAEESQTKIGFGEELSSEPIAKTLYPEGARINDGDVWNGYKAWCQESDGRLFVEAMPATVIGVRWLTGELLELSLDRRPSKVIATPLQPVPEGYREDEARAGDIAVFLGRYIALGEKTYQQGPDELFSMSNYLRVVSMDEQNVSRRGRNRIQESEGRRECCFR